MEIILISGFYLGSQAKELRLVNNSTISTNYLFSLYQDNRQVYFINWCIAVFTLLCLNRNNYYIC